MVRFWSVDFWEMEAHTAVIEATPRWRFTPEKRLAKCGTVVCRAYSQTLRAGPPVEAKTSWGRFIFVPDAPPAAFGDVAATASLGMGEVHEVPPPPLSLLELPDRDRRLALLDFLHQHLLQLAAARGWEQEPFELARQAVVDADLEYVLQSPPKASPDRRHTADVRLEVDGVGDSWLTLRVRDRDGAIVHMSPPLMTQLSSQSFNAVRRSLRWANASRVTVDSWPLDEPFGPTESSAYTASIDRPAGAAQPAPN